MAVNDSKDGYGVVSMINHWVIGLSVIGLIIFGLTAEGMEPRDPERLQIIAMHKAFGVTVLVLALWRLGWRLKQGFPPPAPNYPAWQINFARFMHWFLLIAIILMPLSGLLWSLFGGRDVSIFGLFAIPGFAENENLSDAFQAFHRMFSKALIAGIAIHAAAGVYHGITNFSKEGSRMFLPK